MACRRSSRLAAMPGSVERRDAAVHESQQAVVGFSAPGRTSSRRGVRASYSKEYLLPTPLVYGLLRFYG
jgi:hypothetical protein